MDKITDLRKTLLENINAIKDGSLPVKEADSISNTAGKVLKSVQVELKYSELRDEKPDIDFLKK